MNYPDELQEYINMIDDESWIVGYNLEKEHLEEVASYAYKLGLEKGWQYQQDNDRMQNEETE